MKGSGQKSGPGLQGNGGWKGSWAWVGIGTPIKKQMFIFALDKGSERKERKWQVWGMEGGVKLGLEQKPTW